MMSFALIAGCLGGFCFFWGVLGVLLDRIEDDRGILIGIGLVLILVISPFASWYTKNSAKRERAAELQIEQDYPGVDVVRVQLDADRVFVWIKDDRLCRAPLSKFNGAYVLPADPSCSILPG